MYTANMVNLIHLVHALRSLIHAKSVVTKAILLICNFIYVALQSIVIVYNILGMLQYW